MVRIRKPVAGASYPGNTDGPTFRAFLIRADQVLDSNEVIMDVKFDDAVPKRGVRMTLKWVVPNSPAILDALRNTLLDNGSKCGGRVIRKIKTDWWEVELFLGTRSINADLCSLL